MFLSYFTIIPYTFYTNTSNDKGMKKKYIIKRFL